MPSESEFIGSMVSIDCGALGSYQGHVMKIDPVMNTLTISHAFHNGLRCDQPEVNLSSTTILDIKIIHSSTEAKEIIDRKRTPSKMTKEIDEVTKPTCSSPVKIIQAASKARSSGFAANAPSNIGFDNSTDCVKTRAMSGCRRKLSPPESPSNQESMQGGMGPRPRMSKSTNRDTVPEDVNNGNHTQGGKATVNAKGRGSNQDHHAVRRTSTAARKMDRGGKVAANSRNKECFSAPTNSFLQEFDFESNLALFNKKAVFQEIENGFPDLSIQAEPTEPKYRHDENILQPGESTSKQPFFKQQIKVPEIKSDLYYTDNGLLVPSVSLELREQLCEEAAKSGLSPSRQLEAYGRAASEMAMHLIGGSHRIHPKNDHQMPVVAVICGPHTQGTLGACCARILASHGVQTPLLLPCSVNLPQCLSQELDLYKLNGGSVLSNVKDLPDTIDLVVLALDSPTHSALSGMAWYRALTSWLNSGSTKAQVLALDPPPSGPAVTSRWSLFKVLPLSNLSPTCGSVYLCDLSIPSAVFKKVGVKYTSPFGSKFVIPLHLQE